MKNKTKKYDLERIKRVLQFVRRKATTEQGISLDYYHDPEEFEPSCFPETEAKQMVIDNIDYTNGMDSLEKVYDKGHPILMENF